MRKRNPILEPIKLDTRTWFYVEPRGLHAYREVKAADGGHIKTDDFVIPWRTVVLGLSRYRANVKGKRRRKSPSKTGVGGE